MARTKTKPIGRTPAKRKTCESWLLKLLGIGPCLARDILALGVGSGWGWATVRRAKVNVGAQSFRKAEEWWWFDPQKFDPQRDALPQKPPRSRPEAFQALQQASEATSTLSLAPVQHDTRPPVTSPALLPLASPFAEVAQEHSTIPGESAQPQVSSSLERVHIPAVVPATQRQVISKPPSPPKQRPFHIWDSAVTETRDALICSAGFADLYTMRLDIRFRQEHLRARGLLKEEAALNELLARVNGALEKKKKAANLE